MNLDEALRRVASFEATTSREVRDANGIPNSEIETLIYDIYSSQESKVCESCSFNDDVDMSCERGVQRPYEVYVKIPLEDGNFGCSLWKKEEK